MESRQNSFFSQKMEHFLSDREKEEQQARKQAMEKALSEKVLNEAVERKLQEWPGVPMPVRLTSVPDPQVPLRGPALAGARLRGPTLPVRLASVSAPQGGVPRVEVRTEPMVVPMVMGRPLATVQEATSEFLRTLSPKKMPGETEIKIEAHEQTVRKSCCFWDCRVND
ncbi:unnamed protein product [Durusdinium trenchii]|uniref:Uncharacterized protein n=1 Tax=Durusdinium trenchii TaxID=1381693 RepID=A0ABP0IS96_9DINO